jgi:hypothetical protein
MRHSDQAKIFEKLYERIIPLFRKANDSWEFAQLLDLVGMAPDESVARGYRFYNYWNFGFILIYDVPARRFRSVGFEYDTAGTRAREVNQYKGDLPAGIKWSDSCTEVERKLGIKPVHAGWDRGCDSASCDAESRASSYSQRYECPPYQYNLTFGTDKGGLGHLEMRTLAKTIAANER